MTELNERQPLVFGLKPDTVQNIKSVFAAHPQVKQVLLYGSRATGTFKPTSDIDLCISGGEMTMALLVKIENDLDDLLLPYKIDLSIRDHIDNPELLAHIQRAGVSFYRR